MRMAMEDTPRNKDVIQGWVDKWYDLASPAMGTFFPILAEKPDAERKRIGPKIPEEMAAFYAAYLESMCLRRAQ
jgi:hypothetical protein